MSNLGGIQILILKCCQNENSDGNVVSGEYRVLLPDGRTQIVRWTTMYAEDDDADVDYWYIDDERSLWYDTSLEN